MLHDTVTAGLMFARCKYGSDRLGATDRTERILGWQRYVGEQRLLDAQTLNELSHILNFVERNMRRIWKQRIR